jgi:hypothetical protein
MTDPATAVDTKLVVFTIIVRVAASVEPECAGVTALDTKYGGWLDDIVSYTGQEVEGA